MLVNSYGVKSYLEVVRRVLVVTINNKSINITKIKVNLKIKGRELSSRGETVMTVCK